MSCVSARSVYTVGVSELYARTVYANVPATEGVPASRPPLVKVRPVGREPATTANVGEADATSWTDETDPAGASASGGVGDVHTGLIAILQSNDLSA